MITKLLFEEDQRLRSVLTVPYYSQPDESQYCVPYSIKMVNDYYREQYQDGIFRHVINDVSADDIAGQINCRRDGGTVFRKNYGKELSALLDPIDVHFSVNEITLDDVRSKFNVGIPVIALYDYLMAYQPQLDRPGPGHASVIVGIDNDSVVLHDPSFNEYVLLPLDVFKKAWQSREYRAILMSIKQGTPVHKTRQLYLKLDGKEVITTKNLDLENNIDGGNEA